MSGRDERTAALADPEDLAVGLGRSRVCFVAGARDSTAPMRQLRDLRDRHGATVAAVVASDEGGMGADLRAWGIPYHVRRLDLGRPFPEIWEAVLDLARLFAREGFDVVQSQDVNASYLARVAAWIADVPVRVTRVVGVAHLDGPTSGMIERATCWMDTAILGVSSTLAFYRSLGVPARRLSWVSSAVDPVRFHPDVPPGALRAALGVAADLPLVGLIAHFYPRLEASPWTSPGLAGRCPKGHEVFLQAAARVRAERGGVGFVLAGSGFDREGEAHRRELMARADALGLRDVAHFPGALRDVPAAIRDLDVCTQPSLSESLASATLEALAMGRPVVASRVGGLPDVVLHERTGLLVAPGDPEALANAILRLLRDPEEAGALGHAGREHVLQMATPRRIAATLAGVYASGLARTRGRRPRVRRWRVRAARALLSLLGARVLWNQIAFTHPPRSLTEHLSLGLIALRAPEWAPELLGMRLYRRWATGVFGFLHPDGSFRPPGTPRR
ncbi:MAG: glycosyltransferase family 4 protein [Vicinamibacteria bacterium]|nr:glycosyltransferase family 4 protein [Vicinamibacteria bacterium]